MAKSHNLALKKGEGAVSKTILLRFFLPSFHNFHQLIEVVMTTAYVNLHIRRVFRRKMKTVLVFSAFLRADKETLSRHWV